MSGTPAYMAPEQYQGYVSPKSDQYALACIAYELLTGHRLFVLEAPSIAAFHCYHVNVQPTVPPHAVKTLSTVLNQYASYDAMGNMICRTVNATGSQSCADGTQTGATMIYDEEGQLVHWQAPVGKTDTDDFLYDTHGNRVLQRSSVTKSGTTTVTDTIYFDGYTEVAISGGTTTVTKYYTVNGQKVAMSIDHALHYLMSDLLGRVSVTLKSDGSLESSQLFSPFGSVRSRQGTMPTAYNFTGQRQS